MKNPIDTFIEEDIRAIQKAKDEALAECPGDIRAIKIATYNAVINILINATGNNNDAYRLELLDIARNYLEMMKDKIDIINQ